MTDKKVPATLDRQLVDMPGCSRPIPAFLTGLPWSSSAEDAIDEIVDRILRAETVEAVIARSETIQIESMYGQVITIHGFKMMPSDLEQGIGAYALIDYTADGKTEHQVTTTSAYGVLAQLARTYQLSGFPLRCAILEIDTGKNGKNNPVYLGPAGQGQEAF